MKKIIPILLAFLMFYSCGKKPKTTVSVQPAAESVNTVDGENLDLQLVGELYMKSKDAEAFEKKLNDPATKLNNLDLDGNGEVDWITVTEVDSGDPNLRMASLSVNFSETDIEEVATIEVSKTADGGGEVYLTGSESVYGSGAHYQSRMSMSDAILLSYLYSPRYRPYYSPYYGYARPIGYGYSPYRTVPMTQYRTTTRTVRRSSTSSFSKSTTARKSTIKSPNAGKTSQKATAQRQVKSKTQSQKSMNKATDTQKKKLNSSKSAFKKTDTKKTNPNTIKKTTPPAKKKTSYKPPAKKKAPASRTKRKSGRKH